MNQKQIDDNRIDLLFAVSHELKTPLMLLNQSKEMMESSPEKWLEYRSIWTRNLQRLGRMINNLIDSQRTNNHMPLILVCCDPVYVLNQILDDLAPWCQAVSVRIAFDHEQMTDGICDQESMSRVVENLLTNAIKFSHRNGRVDVRMKHVNGMLQLEIEDYGGGIPKDEIDTLFKPFARTRFAIKRGVPGTGLGLYVSYKIVKAHGGTMMLKSEEGKGTKVTIRLPWNKCET